MTPWQKEHLLYLEKNGHEEPADTEETNEDATTAEEKTNDSEEIEEDTEVSDESERISFADRLPKLKEYRNKQLYQRLLLLTLLFLVPLLATVYWISPLNQLAEVTVKGNQKVSDDAIINASNLEIHESLWSQFFERQSAAAKIKKQVPRIDDVTITIDHLNQFAIDVTEHQEVALLVKGKEYLPILDNGLIIDEPQKEASQDKVIFEGFKEEAKILETLTAYHKLAKEIQEGISQIKYAPTAKNDQLLNLYMNDGNQVIVNISNMASQMKYYAQVAKELDGKGIVDMEVGIFAYPYPTSDSSNDESSQETVTESNEEINF